MSNMDLHTAACILEDEHFALSRDIRLAQFTLGMMFDKVPDEDYIAKASHTVYNPYSPISVMVMTEERRYIMKKIISLFLALVLCLALCACGSGDTDTVVQNTTDEQSTQQSTETSIGQEDSGKYVAYTYDGEEVDLFTVEEVVLMPESYSNGTIALNWKMKVRNTSGEDLLMKESSMRVWYRYLDENGDTLFSNYSSAGYSNTIKAGKAEWIDCSGTPAGWDNADIENVAYIEIYGYTNTLHGSPDYEFTNYITIDISEFFDWDEVISK